MAVDEVLFDCVWPPGLRQAPARQAALGAGVAASVPATTVNKMCGSGMKALMLAADQILAGNASVSMAGGLESMSNAPYLLLKARAGYRMGHGEIMDHMFYDGLQSPSDGQAMGCFAETTAEKYGFSRAAQDAYAPESVRRAQRAVRDGDLSGTQDSGLQRVDATPTVRFPWRKSPFFTVNSSLGWRYTWWSESISPATNQQVPQSISRNYFDLQARIVGPVVNRIFNTPDSGYAEKIKHTIEPWVNLQRVTSIDLDNRIVRLDSADYVVGGTTRVTYGLNNRVYGKRKGGADGGRSREILNVVLRQTYYTNALASVVDPNYATSFGTVAPICTVTGWWPVSLLKRSSSAARSARHRQRYIKASGYGKIRTAG